MRKLTVIFTALFFFLVPGLAMGQALVTDISEYNIELRHSFTGQELLVFGAIKSDTEDLESSRYDVAIVISGAERSYLVRKKEEVFGLWVNTDELLYNRVPGYYNVASTRPLREITDAETRQSLQLGVEYHLHDPQGDPAPAELAAYDRGLIENRRSADVYQISTEEMPIQGDTLFRAEFFFPANVPSGTYEAQAFLFRDGKLLSRSAKAIRIDKVGFERAVFNLAHNQPALYGLIAVIIALLAGWLAGFVTRPRTKIN